MPYHRKTAPKVTNGRVQHKNRWRFGEPDYRPTHQIKIERFKPSPGYRHLVSPSDVSAFLALLPDWRELSVGLQRVVLSADTESDGWCSRHTVAVCAWVSHYARIISREYYDDHAAIFRRMGVPCRPVVLPEPALCPTCFTPLNHDAWDVCDRCNGSLCDAYEDADPSTDDPCYLAAFTESTAQAFLLVHVLVHELGHHHDRMTSPGRKDFTRGERYAEDYARRYEDRIWPAYCRVFRPHECPRSRCLGLPPPGEITLPTHPAPRPRACSVPAASARP